MIKKILVFIGLLLTSWDMLLAQSKEVVVDMQNIHHLQLVGKQLYFCEDKTGEMTIQNIQKPENSAKFTLFNKDVFARPATKSVFWFKVNMQNHTHEDAWLEVGSTVAWYIDFYAPDNSGNYTNPIQTGALRPAAQKLYEVNLFWLPLNKAGQTATRTYYFRIQTKRVYELPIQVGTIRALYKNKTLNDYLVAAFVGIVIIMFLYNLFLYISVKDRTYLYYLGYLFCSIFSFTFLHNYPLVEYLEIGFLTKIWWHDNFTIWIAPFYIFMGLFCLDYLELKTKMPRFRHFILLQIVILSFIFPLCRFFDITFIDVRSLSQIVATLFLISCLIPSYYLLFKRDKKARFYALGWTFMVIATICFVLVINGVLPFNPFTRNAIIVGSVLEFWMFSLALADRMNIIKNEKEQLIKDQNAILEHKVVQRTAELSQTNEALNTSLETVAHQRDNILSSINYAKRIQQALLPAREIISEHLQDFLLYYQPKDIVSGDFYWFTHTGDFLFLAVADCTGHGVPGAFMTVVGEVLLDQIINKDNIYSPAEILTELDKRLLKNLQQKKEKLVEDGMDISLLRIDLQNQPWVWAGAKRSIWIFEQGKNELTIYKGDKYPIGSTQYKDKFFQEKEIEVQKGDIIYTFTDGYADQFGEEGKFTIRRFKELLTTNYQKPFEEQEVILDKTLHEWRKEQPQTDDVLVVGIQV